MLKMQWGEPWDFMTHLLTNHYSWAQVGDRIATSFIFFFIPVAPTRALATNEFSPADLVLRNYNTILINN